MFGVSWVVGHVEIMLLNMHLEVNSRFLKHFKSLCRWQQRGTRFIETSKRGDCTFYNLCNCSWWLSVSAENFTFC